MGYRFALLLTDFSEICDAEGGFSGATLGEQTAIEFMQIIAQDRWRPGQKLPSEAELCKVLNIGRSTLREAFRILAFAGILRLRVGEGTYVSDEPSKFLDRVFTQSLLNADKDLDSLWTTRILLEAETAALCAEHASDENLQALGDILSEMRVSMSESWEAFLHHDVQFHQSIANYSQNTILAELLRSVRGLLQGMFASTMQSPSAMELAFSQHLGIFETLKHHEPRAARRAMRSHLARFREGI